MSGSGRHSTNGSGSHTPDPSIFAGTRQGESSGAYQQQHIRPEDIFKLNPSSHSHSNSQFGSRHASEAGSRRTTPPQYDQLGYPISYQAWLPEQQNYSPSRHSPPDRSEPHSHSQSPRRHSPSQDQPGSGGASRHSPLGGSVSHSPKDKEKEGGSPLLKGKERADDIRERARRRSSGNGGSGARHGPNPVGSKLEGSEWQKSHAEMVIQPEFAVEGINASTDID